MQPKIFAVLICVLMFVGSAFAGPLSSFTDHFAKHLLICVENIEACHDICRTPGACQMLTRGGWVFSPAATNATCVRKCKTVAVAECVGVPKVLVELLRKHAGRATGQPKVERCAPVPTQAQDCVLRPSIGEHESTSNVLSSDCHA